MALQKNMGEEGLEADAGSVGLADDFRGGAAFVAPIDWYGVGIVKISARAGEMGSHNGEEGPELVCFGWVKGRRCRGSVSVSLYAYVVMFVYSRGCMA